MLPLGVESFLRLIRALFLALWVTTGASVSAFAGTTDEGIEFFESRIRPLLVKNCYECHSARAKIVQGKLRLDSRDALRRGGESGAALVPGDVPGSLLVRALRYEDHEMPPKGKLSPAAIADVERWVKMGAPDPRDRPDSEVQPTPGKKQRVIDFAEARKHWAYQPVRNPPLPDVKDTTWSHNEVDRLVLGQLEARGLTPAPAADRRTLLRRVSLDLIGLPPTFREVESFANDDSPRAFEKVVDRLLASPHYGERWGRHWLDVARYADTKDLVLVFGDDAIRPYAYTYRDYVTKAFNDDVPYDRFIVDQLAADQTAGEGDAWRLAAMGYLTLGRLFDYNLNDEYDDRIDTVTRGMLGLTVACARCHDHKYDAIKQADYYSLYGVFASSEEPVELPLLADPAKVPGSAEFQKKFAATEKTFQEHVERQFREQTETTRRRVGDYLVTVATTRPDPNEDAVFFMSLSPDQLRPQIVGRWRRYLALRSTPNDPVFAAWADYMRLTDADFEQQVSAVTRQWLAKPRGTAAGQLNPLIADALAATEMHGKADVAKAFGQAFLGAYAAVKVVKKKAHRELRPPEDVPARRQLLDVLTGQEGPAWFPRSNAYLYMSRVERDRYHQLQLELDRVAVKSRGTPPRAMVVSDAATLCSPRIFVRGNPSQPGDHVPRQFLQLLAGDHPQPFTHGSGRLDLARAIASRDNPLTARVFVNRVWMHHFGEPLVSSPSDFGVRAAPPTNPKLLDYLASSFMADNWSIKNLHRRIVLSAAYQQSSADRPECRKVDPENRLQWKFNRQRLDMEAMRDSMLAVSGRLDPQLFGRPADIVGDPNCRRRTLYGLVDRQHLPGFFRAFDFANPDQSAERRPQTTVPQQALFAMNSPFMLVQAKSLVARPQVAGKLSPVDRVESLYEVVFGRRPEEAETELALQFLDRAQPTASSGAAAQSQLAPWAQYAQVLLASNEFLFVD
ncbi:MAG TPA: PSD1 and planctomycete cytochrome C domain-containing protein [Planctomycetaceae bacterium]|nr:PSD1 and planctomycete cytochrome C domain-containing protein [Planctomycetaceae bacterium]